MHTQQEFMIAFAHALNFAGAPTHKVEASLYQIAELFDIKCRFDHLVTYMVIYFDSNEPSENIIKVRFLPIVQSINLAKLQDIHEIYQEVIHDVCPIEDAVFRLNAIKTMGDDFPPWVLAVMCGLSSAVLAPVVFHGTLFDMPVCLCLGGMVGAILCLMTPHAYGFNTPTLEIILAVGTSFVSRALGSIHISGGSVFCFSTLSLSSIGLVGPGYTILRGMLEMQSPAIMQGALRLVTGSVYSMFLACGIIAGSTLYDFINTGVAPGAGCTNVALDSH
jgi:uncharacterized membrane protein YjjP (DUF1212 family)